MNNAVNKTTAPIKSPIGHNATVQTNQNATPSHQSIVEIVVITGASIVNPKINHATAVEIISIFAVNSGFNEIQSVTFVMTGMIFSNNFSSAGIIAIPIVSPTFPSVFFNCCILPWNVHANASFIFQTLSVTNCASIHARSCSFQSKNCFFCASVKMIPYLARIPTFPDITFPKRLAVLIMSPDVAFTPLCCATKLFIAGINVSMDFVVFKNVASCHAPATCKSSSITPIFCCASVNFNMLLTCSSVALVLFFNTVVNFVSASIASIHASTNFFHTMTSQANANHDAIRIASIDFFILSAIFFELSPTFFMVQLALSFAVTINSTSFAMSICLI
jgi:hypothetical protein